MVKVLSPELVSDGGLVKADRLGGQGGSYYLDWDNFVNTPTTILDYGITDAYTKVEVDALIESVGAAGASLVTQAFTATEGQTVFTLSTPVVAGTQSVFLDGKKMVNGDDVLVNNGNQVTFTLPVEAGRLVEVTGFGSAIEVSNAVPLGRTVTAGLGLTGGGTLSANISLDFAPSELTTKGSIVDADTILIADSAASNGAKRVSLANFKTALDARYFTETEINTMLAGYYTKSEVYSKTETYAKSEVYSKTETYTQSQVDSLIAGIDTSVQVAEITDSTATGRSLLTASSAAAAWATLLAGTQVPISTTGGASSASLSASVHGNYVEFSRALGVAISINPATLTSGWWCIVSAISTATASSTITPTSGTIDGRSSIRVYPKEKPFKIIFDGTNFWTVGRDRVVLVQAETIAASSAQVRSTWGFNDPEIREIEYNMQDLFASTTVAFNAQLLTSGNVRIAANYSTKGMSGTTTSFPYAAQSTFLAASVFTSASTARVSGRINLFQNSGASGSWFWEYWFQNTASAQAKGHGNYLKSSFNGGADPAGLDIFPSTGTLSGGYVDVVLKR